MIGTDNADREQSKGAQFAEMVDKYLGPPEADHVLGRCEECESEVWIDTGLRPAGMAVSCGEHRPLCVFQEGSRHV